MLAVTIDNRDIVIEAIAYVTQQTDNESTSYTLVLVDGTSSCTNWVYGVSATGTFIKPSGTTIPTGVTGIPSGWTVINK